MKLAAPLRFRPVPFPKVWGGDRLEGFLGERFPERPVGEVWQLSDRAECESIVAQGELAGRSLGSLGADERAALLGALRPSAGGRFPLLVKLLDTAQPLSIQVHPDAGAAARLGGEAKDECWYVLHARAGGVVHLGLREGVDAAELARAAGRRALVDLLRAFPVRAGQFVAVPAGTPHAIGAGLTLVEIQENADTTYRLFDWDRAGGGRALHLEQGLQSIRYGAQPPGPIEPRFEPSGAGVERAPLWSPARFRVDLLRATRPCTIGAPGIARPMIYVVVGGGGALRVAGVARAAALARGQTWLLPASAGEPRVEPLEGGIELLVVEPRS